MHLSKAIYSTVQSNEGQGPVVPEPNRATCWSGASQTGVLRISSPGP